MCFAEAALFAFIHTACGSLSIPTSMRLSTTLSARHTCLDRQLYTIMFTTAATVLAFAAAIATATDSTSDCAVQPAGLGPIPTPNTDTAFAASTVFASLANNAVTPPLYSRVFVNLNASESATSTNVYLGYYELASYDPASCTALCDKTSGCVATNLYFEVSHPIPMAGVNHSGGDMHPRPQSALSS